MATTTRKKETVKSAAAAEPAQASEPAEKIIPKEVDLNQYITVKNGFHGLLIYQSSRTGEVFKFERYGDEQDIELRELRNARNSAKDFFINNWFMFDEDNAWVIDYLGLGQYYRYTVSADGFRDIIRQGPDKTKEALGKMSDGQKRSIAYFAKELIESGEIDSRKTIAALEDALGIDLIEK